jgi:hypothetical protein
VQTMIVRTFEVKVKYRNMEKAEGVFNATFINISVISWRSVLLVEITEVTRENHRLAASY